LTGNSVVRTIAVVAAVRLAQHDFRSSRSAAAMIRYSACDVGLNE